MIGDDIDVDIRDAARGAARRKGLSVGEWLDDVMTDLARKLGVNPSDLGADDCLKAITARLAQADDRQNAPAETPAQFMAGIQAARMRTAAAAMAATRPDSRHGLSPLSPRPGSNEDVQTPASLAPPLDKVGTASSEPTFRGERRRTLAAVMPASGVESGEKNVDVLLPTLVTDHGGDQRHGAASAGQERGASPAGPSPIEAKLSALFQALNRHHASAAPGAQSDGPPAVFAPPASDLPTRQQTLPRPAPKSSSFNLEQAIAAIGRRQAVLDGSVSSPSSGRAMTNAAVSTIEGSAKPSMVRSVQAHVAPPAPVRRHDDRPEAPKAIFAPPVGDPTPGEPATEGPVPGDAPAPANDPLATNVFTTLQTDIARMSSRLEAMLDDGSKREPFAPLPPDHAIGELRSIIDKMRPDQTLGSLEQRMAALTARVDQPIETQLQPDVIERLSQRIENVRSSLAEHVTAERQAPVDTSAMERAIRELAASIAAMQNEATDIRALDDMVHRLADKLDRVTSTGVDQDMVAGLKGQIGTLADRIDRSDASLNAMIAVDRSMGDMFSHLEKTRGAAITAAEDVARATARDTLVAVMADKGLPLNQRTPDPAMAQVTHDIADLRQARDLADKRLNGILSTLNITLEKVVERLSALEEDGQGLSAAGGKRVQSLPPSPGEVTIAGAANPLNPAHRSRAIPSVEVAVPIASPRRTVRPLDANTVGDADFMLEPVATGSRTSDAGRSADEPVLAATTDLTSDAPTDPALDPASFIAAARKAAQTAMRDSASRPSVSATSRARGGAADGRADQPAPAAQLKRHVAARRRPLLLAAAGLVLLMGTVQVARIILTPGGSDMAQLDQRDVDTAKTHPESTKTSVATDARIVTGDAPDRRADEVDAAARPAPAVPPTVVADQASMAAPPTAVKPLPTLAMGAGSAHAAQQAIGAGLRDMANDGSASAQYEIGLRMADGRGVPRDPKGAADWFEKAAKQGLAPAAYRLGSLYEKGTGVTKDAALSIQWYEKAAAAGNIRAMHNLAVMSAEGANGKPDYAKASSWFTKAAESGVRDSQFNLAILYARGLGIEQNLTQSYIWFSLAAAQGDSDAATKRDEVAQRLDAKTLAAAKKTAESFQPAASVAAANEVPAPPGGWDELAPRTTPVSSIKAGSNARVSSSSM